VSATLDEAGPASITTTITAALTVTSARERAGSADSSIQQIDHECANV
jgi:hypothetical protein